ncbi:class 1 isoprenoid biosynthesis enzyme [Rhodococcoides yunnanense]|uniref:Class 1 isoprenoid biosynthesis enzyme n=1 Tax=Rhodococcoides yunnanense TaxID=278209 RepID=A0ABU4B9X8_9NOCA|nr:class 1 isoprenoid biosynthesis enzyme [Rhodococcus yunnanensis]MDV6260985.1 class 1 isoprenoid biosynthesis enzyme [Rhodococcus yunnanensis]
MKPARLLILARGVRDLRRAVDPAALVRAGSPDELAESALIPAARNLAVAINLLPEMQRAESTATVLACRVLDAYEDLYSGSAGSATTVLWAARYLVGDDPVPPPPLRARILRESDAVDSILAERITDVRALVARLPAAGHTRVRELLIDVATAMAENLDVPMSRVTYGERVLGRVVVYACAVICENDQDVGNEDVAELAHCVGAAAQLANDLRDQELELYRVGTSAELTHEIVLRLLTPALGAFALLSHLGRRIRGKGARAAVAYMSITTTAFFCGAVGVRSPYSRRLRLVGAMVAATGTDRWEAMLDRLRDSVDSTVEFLLDSWTPGRQESPHNLFPRIDAHSQGTSMGAIVVDSAMALVDGLPTGALRGELPDDQVRRMMIADHLAFGSLERMHPGDSNAMHLLGTRFQTAAMSRTAPHLPFDSERQS